MSPLKRSGANFRFSLLVVSLPAMKKAYHLHLVVIGLYTLCG